ncbi:MAG TPA: GAF domain-containing protein [Chloroflexota bacterium]|nr:GAF domain-containing protein [Chloroflexota bacterium]HUM68246.1 GAF domain-containing protein [Chloroflexota bacterium]
MTHADEMTPPETTAVQKRALLKLAILTGATLLFVLFYFYVGIQLDMPAVMTVAAILTGFVLLTIVAIYLVRKGRVQQGIWLVFIGMMIIWPLSVLLLSGLGIVLGLSLPILVILITDNILPRKGITQATIIATVVGTITLLIDLYGPASRTQVPDSLQLFLPGMIVVIALVYGLFIAFNFKNYSMRAKLITATAMVAIVSVVAVTVIVGITTRNALVNQVGGNLNSLAGSQALALGEVMARQINIMETLALNRAVSDAVEARNTFYQNQTPEEIEASILQLSQQWRVADSTDRLVLSVVNNTTSQQLITFQQTFPDHNRIVLTDAHGALVAASHRPDRFDYSNEEWWRNASSTGFATVHVGQPYVDANRDEVLVDIAVPVRTRDNTGRSRVSGVLLTSYSLNSLVQILREAAFGQTGHFDLHFPNFRQIEVRGDNEVQLRFIPPAEASLVDELRLDNLPFLNTVYNGAPSLVSQGRVNTLANEPKVDSLGWRVVAVQEEAEALQPVEQQQRTNALLGVIIVLLASVTAAVVAQVLARPIIRLTNTAVSVAEGDLSARAEVTGNDEIGTLALTFNQMTEQMQHAITDLERRVTERTHALTTSIEVSRSLSTILDPDQLVIEIVEQVRSAFDYYYVQIYLLDDQGEILHMRGGTGEAGQMMLARQHQLPIGQGLVGRAAADNTAVFIPDVSQSPDWKSNPLLPDTRAEIAVPIAIGDHVLGVLDVQHDVNEGLTEGDLDLLQSVASQVAIAFRNARSFEEARKQAERENRVNIINQKIQQAPTIESVLQVATKELGDFLGQRLHIQVDRQTLHAGENGNQLIAKE